ncbi:MAG: hypothetical protein PHE55_01235 [Methylococcaceae bacterium]|nr:hypothetical protein [Methylococcaceae bacterium]
MHPKPSSNPSPFPTRPTRNHRQSRPDIAETSARAAIAQLGVSETTAPEHLDDRQKQLRSRLRAQGHQLGDNYQDTCDDCQLEACAGVRC